MKGTGEYDILCSCVMRYSWRRNRWTTTLCLLAPFEMTSEVSDCSLRPARNGFNKPIMVPQRLPKSDGVFAVNKRRVLLISSQTLFGESLELLLRSADDIEVIGSVVPSDSTCNHILQVAPDVVVFAEEYPESDAAINLTTALMEQFPNLRVIKTNLEQTTLRVFAAQTWPASSIDLISAIRAGEKLDR